MRKTSVEIDDDLVARVRIILGTKSIKETIDKALREVERPAPSSIWRSCTRRETPPTTLAPAAGADSRTVTWS